MRGRELAGIAHVVAQIEQFGQAHARQVDDVVALADWRLLMRSIG